MGTSLLIEPMTGPDLAAVVAMDSSTHTSEEQLREELARSWSHVWVARARADTSNNDEVVAFLVAWHVADELHVLNVTTRADRRRRGIARAMMETAVAYGRRSRVKQILLEVRRSNRAAISLYRSVGFFATNVRPRYYPDDEDAVEMLLVFDPETRAVVDRADEVKLD
ncbi:MAG: ribosomal protein S18-alanine N-acetyltransferase [Myxococcota bacterium]|nr:ribosomal protein S18-alanine N-acetyltransferase [Myxococcota bacterium]